MPDSWPMEELGRLGVSVLDCEHKTPPDAGSGYPYIAIPNLADGRLVLDKVRRICREDYLSWTRRTKPQPGDVIVTRRGRVGDTAVVPVGVECAIGQNLVIIRSDNSVIDQRYLRWASRGPIWDSEVDRILNVGAIFSSLNVREIPAIRIPVPPLKDQRAIAAILGALDDKIAVNERIVECSDELRRLELMHFLNSGTGVDDRPLTSFAEFVNGRAFTKDATGTGRMVVRIAELNSGPGGSTVYNDIEVPERHLTRPGDILFAWSGSLTVARWYRQEAIINQHIFKVISKNAVPMWLAYELVLSKLAAFKSIAADKATTMGHIQRHHLEESVAAPAADSIPCLHRRLGPLWDRALAAEQESLALADLRDRLLPGLVSGAIRVRDAEKAVEDAT